ncbi:hypothetical protein ABB37_04258 [Leptomonas pyrrhocoris]|uniref:Uncharacterized protein n=1 Tax=Leptomonas pyrrhocoris TaxID=157538 RepID=A0A0N0DVZ5_LEPPY|nr:hypothetical protein ABB37_04258 [Leptomonas pyrrhocoris]KPA80831.1 hypothetical protein ABB37_04258 [Leptomonas pyrrhocoris]|eukprot:XP_015659270.1 hypothetical protein ABB37_04258 [Leptomonas pyrrhocoris]
MSLSLSCDGLYFPAEPYDNITTLKWNPGGTPLEPNTSVIFKVKCTAPQLFHVVPRYGAIPLADATGTSVQPASKATTITFGLREHHAGAEEENGAAGGNGTAVSAMNRGAASPQASRATSAAPGGPPYQERFAVEYVMIKSEPLAFQQIFNSLADHRKLTEVVKNMWSLVASSAIPSAHMGTQASINLKVFMENVVMNRNDPAPPGRDEATKIVVPIEARLVAPNAHERASRTDGHNPSSAASHKTSENASATASTPPSSRRKAVDELRALKEEINLMRRDSSASQNGSPQNAASTPTTQRSADARRVLDSLSPPPRNSSSPAAAAAASPLPAVEGEDIVMKFDYGGDDSKGGVGAKEKKRGLKVYLVLALMFALYTSLLVMRRGTKHSSVEVSDNAYAVQVSSREVENRKL